MGVTDVTRGSSVTEAPLTLVLAAGAGTRMGGPKIFARVRNTEFCVHLHRALMALGWPTIWVLHAPHQVEALARLIGEAPEYCINDTPEGDMLSSLVAGLRSPAAHLARSFCVWPVDFPLVGAQTLRRLADGLGGSDAIMPAREGRTGMPLLVRRHALCRWLSLLPHDGLRQAMHENPARVGLLDVSEDGPFRNLNTPADCLAATENPD